MRKLADLTDEQQAELAEARRQHPASGLSQRPFVSLKKWYETEKAWAEVERKNRRASS